MSKPLRTILLAEDNENDIELTMSTLESFNLANEIHVVRDGVEVLDYLLCRGQYADRKSIPPAVILLDIKMPKVDGLQVLEAIKSHKELRTIPVVMLTSSRQEPDVCKSYSMGVNAYVVKPVDYEQFSDAIRHLGIFWALLNEPPLSPTNPAESN